MTCVEASQSPTIVPGDRKIYGKASASVEVSSGDDKFVTVTIVGPGGSEHCFEVEWHSAFQPDGSPHPCGGHFDEDRIWAGGPSTLARVDEATGSLYVNRQFADEELGINENFWAVKWPDSGGE